MKYDEQDFDTDTDEESEVPKTASTGGEDDWNEVGEDRKTKRTRERNEKKFQHWQKKHEKKV